MWPQLMWRTLLVAPNTMMLKRLCCKKGVHLEPVCCLLRESCDFTGRINLPGAPISPAFLYARGARQESVEGLDMWNQVLDNGLREPAARWESEGIGLWLATDKRRRGTSGEAMKNEGSVLHHLCWAGTWSAVETRYILMSFDGCQKGRGDWMRVP